MSKEELACEMYCSYNSAKDGCGEDVHKDMWQYLRPFDKGIWLSVAEKVLSLTQPKPKKV